MAKVVGLGGVFFKSSDPGNLAKWYKSHLDLPIDVDNPSYGASFQSADVPAGGYQVWSPFKADTTYLNPSKKQFMFNLMVDDLDGALEQVAAGGAEIVGEIDESEYGRFGWFIDPEGNKVELWEPPKPSV
ncbi:MAG: VOC family protein [Rhodothermales bacterium]|nr:VOC family protein [Rhodothermales bacterium]